MEPNNGLALEYERQYGRAGRNVDVSDLINNPRASGKCRVFGLGLPEEPLDLLGSELCAFLDNGPDALLVREEPRRSSLIRVCRV